MFNYDRFEALRAQRGITKKFVADTLKRTPTLCQDWKQGKSAPNPHQIEIVAELLGTTAAYLNGETDEKEKPAPSDGNGHEPLDYDDAAMLDAWRSAPEATRQAIRLLLKF